MAQVKVIKYLDGPMGVTNKIKQAMYNVAQQFVYIGFLLWEVQEYGYFREHGYENVYQYAEVELDMKKTTVKNLMGINYAFGCRNDRERGGIANSRTISLQVPYEKFKYSQLTEMLSMSPAQRKQVTPDMTVKQIREIKKADKEPKIDFDTLDSLISAGQTSDQPQIVEVDKEPEVVNGFQLFLDFDELDFLRDYLTDEIEGQKAFVEEYETTSEFQYLKALLDKLEVR